MPGRHAVCPMSDGSTSHRPLMWRRLLFGTRVSAKQYYYGRSNIKSDAHKRDYRIALANEPH